MIEKLNAEFDEILKVVKKCPPDLQEVALKTILENWFRANALPTPASPAVVPPGPSVVPPPPPAAAPASQLSATFRPFMVANSLTEARLAKVYHPVGAGAQLVISDIPGKGKASQEISLALLLCVGQALATGIFQCGLKELRQMCLHYDCYDTANFAATLNKHAVLFKARKKGEDIELAGPGMKKAADLIKSIATES